MDTHQDQPATNSLNTENKTIAVIGAGISGLLACKYALQKGFLPTVFEARNSIGGVWSFNVLHSTKLQTPKYHFQFSDFPWPDYVAEEFPHHRQVMDYLTEYAVHFNVLSHIRFNHKVISIDYVSSSTLPKEEEPVWGESGHAFSDQGKWNVTVQETSSDDDSHKEYKFDFVILCIGKFGDVANIPQFPMNKGPEVFKGKVLHSMDYAALTDDNAAAELVQHKRVTVIGFQKSAIDIISEISQLNGTKNPCTLVFRRAHWSLSEKLVVQTFRNLNRFSELMVHKPNQGFFLWFLACLLSPMLWIYSKVMESYLTWIYPLVKYNTVPEHPFLNQIRTCTLTVLPPNLYDKVREGSIILKKSHSFHFCEKGIVVTGDQEEENVEILESDVVIFATGYASQHKLASIFKSTHFQKCLSGMSAPLYRECIHPKIPNLAILGYSDSHAVLYSTEMRAKWVSCFLEGRFKLPEIREMEDNVMRWENCLRKQYSDVFGGQIYRPSCVSVMLQIYCNDEICRDMNCNPKRKTSIFSELFAPYGPSDYADAGK